MNSKQLDYLSIRYVSGNGQIHTTCPLCQDSPELVKPIGYRLTINSLTGWVDCSWGCNAGAIKQWFRTAVPPTLPKYSDYDLT